MAPKDQDRDSRGSRVRERAVFPPPRLGRGQVFFDTSVFRAVTLARFGNAGRNRMRGPGLIGVDMGLFRAFHFRLKSGDRRR